MATWNCENCNRSLRAEDAMVGRFMRCPYCEHAQRVPGRPVLSVTLEPEARTRRPRRRGGDEDPDRIVITEEDLRSVRLPSRQSTASTPSVSVQRRRATRAVEEVQTVQADTPLDADKCPYCLCEFEPGQKVVLCPECKMPHHLDCWQENEGCTQFGCEMAPLRSSVGPPAVEPQRTGLRVSRHRCNRCGRFMPVGSDRCPHCDGLPMPPRRRVGATPDARAVQLANGAIGRAVFALIWVIVMMQIVLNAVSPRSGAQVVALLFMLAPGFIVAIAAIRRAAGAMSALRVSGGMVGRGRAVLAILLAVATLVICVGTLLVAVEGSQR